MNDAYNLSYFYEGTGIAVCVGVCSVNYIVQSIIKISINPSSFRTLMEIWFSNSETINKEYV